MIKEIKVNLSIEIFYLNHQHLIDNYNENSTLYQLLEIIEKFILKNYPKTNLKNIIHRWSELYKAYQKSKYITIYEFLTKKEKKNLFKYMIAYGGYIYFKYIPDKCRDFSISKYNLIPRLINNEAKCSAFTKLSLKLSKYILHFLTPFEIISLNTLNKGFIKIIESKKSKNKFSNSKNYTKSVSPSSYNIIAEDQSIIMDILSFTDYNYLLKYDGYSTIYFTRRTLDSAEEILRSFPSEFTVVNILDNIYVFDPLNSTENKLPDYIDEANGFHFRSIVYESNVAMIYFYDYNEKYFYAVNALGDIYSYDKTNHQLEKVFKINKKESGINIAGNELQKVVVKSYGFGDNIMICLNRLVIYNLKQQRRIYVNNSIKVIKYICDSLIENNLLLLELKRELVVFDVKKLEIVYKMNKNVQISLCFDAGVDLLGDCSSRDSNSNSTFYHILRLYYSNNFEENNSTIKLKRKGKNICKFFITDRNKTLLRSQNNNLVKVSVDLDEKNQKIQHYTISHDTENRINIINYELYKKFDERNVYEKRHCEKIFSTKPLKKEFLFYYDFYTRNNSPYDTYSLTKRITTDESVEIYFNHKGKFITRKTGDEGNTYTLFNKEFKEVNSISIKHEYSLFKFNEFYFILFNPFCKQDTSIMIWCINDEGSTFFTRNLISENNFSFCRVYVHLIGKKLFDILEYEDMLEIREYDISNGTFFCAEIHYFLNRLRIDNFYMNEKYEIIINNGSKFYLLVKDLTNCFFSEYCIARSENLPMENFNFIRDGIFLDLKGMAVDFENF